MKKTRIILFLASVMLLAQACKKNSIEQGDYMGTAICASENFAYEDDFKVNGATSSPTAVDLRMAPYYVALTADLSEAVSWTITITGQTSGATKTFTDISDNVNVKWYGNPDGGEAGGDLFFQTGEVVNISFEPACKEAVVIPLTLSHAATFTSYGTVLADFDNVTSVYSYKNTADANIGPWVSNIDTLLAEPSPQGGKCHKMYAPAGHSGWYIGGFGQAVDLSTILGTDLTPETTYINLYIKGSLSGNNNTTVTIDMVETVGTDDYHFKKNVVINWTGWKMVSYPLSALYIGDPLKVKSCDFSVGPNTYNGETECYIDFIIFTKDKPFTGAN